MSRLREDPRWAPRFEHWHEVPARVAQTAPFPAALDARLVELYRSRGFESLYAHQARFVEHALAGRDALVATPTASGKTLCYVLPVLDALYATDGAARSLFLFPTKALSQDQTSSLTSVVEGLGAPWHAYTYDGDTPPSVRRTLRDRGHLVLTNPYMLHAGILPNHAKWSELFRDLRYVVIDEVHTLSGVFGSSVANVLRRLVRIARHYGSDPRFLLCSATLREGREHARRLIGRDVELVEEDGSPSGPRTFGVYNPPMLNPVAGLRANALEEARQLAAVLCGPAHQTIFFCQRRTSVEVLTRYLKEAAPNLGLSPDEIKGYRGGYLPDLRREIEAGLRSGTVKVVVSTNALELGIDIGALDVAVLVGYPGSQASFWQRAGRVGRRQKPSLVVQVATSDPVDQYLARHPGTLFAAPRERLGLDPDNLVILSEQVKCAAFELPFREGTAPGTLDDPSYGAVRDAAGVLDYLAEESKLLLKRGGTWHWMADAYPAQDVTLAGGEPDNVLVLDADTKKAIGEIDRADSLTTVHEGAIYQVQGETWKVERFDYENRRAYVRRVDSDYFTEAELDVSVRFLRLEERRMRARREAPVARPVIPVEHGHELEDHSVWRGEVHVTTVATQYKKVRFYTRESVGAEDIVLPPEELDTEAFVLTLSDAASCELGLAGGDRGAAWRGVGSLLRRVAPLFLRCQPRDLGLSTQVRSTHFRRPAITLYDTVQGGVGLATLLFGAYRELCGAALEVVSRCDCAQGCPACVGPREEVGPLGKEVALRVLAHLAAGPDPTPADVDERAVEPVA
ncbi:MAG: DEAD/DEAH box helicase [Planctomycetes bacterium]|nr:DEAD/DEAH box helicase [Planctomycetota bacterium]